MGGSDPGIYRPSKYYKDVVNDFSGFLAGITPHDQVLTVGGSVFMRAVLISL